MVNFDYIMPPMPPMPPGMPPPMPPSFSGLSATMTSVVRMFLAMEAAFCRADLVTMAGSMMPALTMSSYSPVAMLRPMPLPRVFTSLTTTEPSRPALLAS